MGHLDDLLKRQDAQRRAIAGSNQTDRGSTGMPPAQAQTSGSARGAAPATDMIVDPVGESPSTPGSNQPDDLGSGIGPEIESHPTPEAGEARDAETPASGPISPPAVPPSCRPRPRD